MEEDKFAIRGSDIGTKCVKSRKRLCTSKDYFHVYEQVGPIRRFKTKRKANQDINEDENDRSHDAAYDYGRDDQEGEDYDGGEVEVKLPGTVTTANCQHAHTSMSSDAFSP